MKGKLLILLFFSGVCIYSCKKYADPPPGSDPRLTNPYCNDPSAVNYNWGFPGKPDNTVCFYPTDMFQGVYQVTDSVFFKETGFFVSADTFLMTIHRHSSTKMGLLGFCSSGDSFLLTANINFQATLDTTLGDTTGRTWGQPFCSIADTVNGVITRDRLNDSILYINFFVSSDTGVVTNHLGTARLKYRK